MSKVSVPVRDERVTPRERGRRARRVRVEAGETLGGVLRNFATAHATGRFEADAMELVTRAAIRR
jgi:hypothetical protein